MTFIDYFDSVRIMLVGFVGATSGLLGYLDVINVIVALIVGVVTLGYMIYKMMEQRKKYLSQRRRNKWEIEDREDGNT